MNTRHNRGRALPTALILLAAFAAGLGLWLGSRLFGEDGGAATPSLTRYPQPREIADFQLVRSDGKPLTRADMKGRWNLLFFGFTHCPDICPNTLGVLKAVRAQLVEAGAADRFGVNFISVDPERDQPEVLGRYTAYYDPGFVAATGTDEQLQRLTRSMGLLYVRVPAGSDGAYSVDHSASVVLLNPQGQLAGLFRPPLDAAAIGKDLLTLVRQNG